ncbi:MAG: hypothetical protein E2O40_02115 [Planctomycetota bacterium]|nr:MAG: hypothetical protein E2O40_02115 [Planctomycetota bacterium]
MGSSMRKLLIGLGIMVVTGGGLFAFVMPKATLLGEVPGRVHSAAPYGDGYLLAAGEAGLYEIDGHGVVSKVYKVTGQNVIDVAVSGDAVYTLAFSPRNRRNDLQAVDPEAGAIVRSISLGGSVVDLAGVLADGQVVIVEGGQVRFIEAGTDHTLSRVQVTGGMLTGAHLVGDRLYASRGFAGGLVTIDTSTPALLDVIETTDWLNSAVVAGRRAYVIGSLKGPGVLDLDTHDYTRVNVIDFFADEAGTGYALVKKAIYKLDEHGKPVRRTGLTGAIRSAVKNAGFKTILAVNTREILIACDGKIFKLVPVWLPLAPAALPVGE